MLYKPGYVVIGIGLEAAGAGKLGNDCPTWPDCSGGASNQGPPSVYDETGYDCVKGKGDYSVVASRVFQEEYAAKGWLASDKGEEFKAAFLNVLIVRAYS